MAGHRVILGARVPAPVPRIILWCGRFLTISCTTAQRSTACVAGCRSTAWLPAAEGTFRRPADLDIEDLPQSFQRDDVLAQALKMVRPVIEEASRQLGFPPDFLRRLSKHPDLVAMIDQELRARASATRQRPE